MTFDASGTASSATVAIQPIDFLPMADESQWKITKPKSIRLEQDLWDDLGPAAQKVGHDRSGVIRQFVRWYLRRPGADLPQRPSA